MKTDDEMYQSLLSRWDDYNENKRRNKIRMILVPAAIALGGCFAFWVASNVSSIVARPGNDHFTGSAFDESDEADSDNDLLLVTEEDGNAHEEYTETPNVDISNDKDIIDYEALLSPYRTAFDEFNKSHGTTYGFMSDEQLELQKIDKQQYLKETAEFYSKMSIEGFYDYLENAYREDVKKTDNIISNPVSGTSVSKGIAFKVAESSYSNEDGILGMEVRSTVIQNANQLKNNVVSSSADYSEEFFNENALVFISVVFPTTKAELPTINNVYYDGSNIQIDVERGPADDEELQWWSCFLEISKADIVDADQSTAVNINIDGKLQSVE